MAAFLAAVANGRDLPGEERVDANNLEMGRKFYIRKSPVAGKHQEIEIEGGKNVGYIEN